MNNNESILILGVVEAIFISGIVFFLSLRDRMRIQSINSKLKENLSQNMFMIQRIKTVMDQIVPFKSLKKEVKALLKAKDLLNLEKGRYSITAAELEAIDKRLRELEEIERELEASNLETKKELDLLDGKYRELKGKNESLVLHIQENSVEYAKTISDLELNEGLVKETNRVKEKFDEIQSQTKSLTEQLENGKNQYVILKRRFDALDIEYAQLYEKYAQK